MRRENIFFFLNTSVAMLGLLLMETLPVYAQQNQQSQGDQLQQVQRSKPSQRQTQKRQQATRRKTQRAAALQQAQQQQKTKKVAQANLSQDFQNNTASNQDVRQFHEVLNDLLTEFAYDVKQGQINGLKNIAVRRVSVSDALPKTYEQYVELLVTEKVRENARVRIINCIPCKTKSSTLVEGKLMVSSPTTNITKMDEAAQQLNIENFMDVVLVYHTTHMVLAFSVFNTTTKEEVWSRTYNSETIRSKYQRLAIDMSQIEKSRSSDEYVPEYKFMLGIGGATLPNIEATDRDKSFVGVHVRSAEKFDNRRLDFGLGLSLWANTSSFIKSYPSEGSDGSSTASSSSSSGTAKAVPYKYLLGLHAVLARNFLGSVESYDRVRNGVHVGLGGVFATGYLAPSLKAGWDVYFGRRWVVTVGGQYITPSTILVGKEYVQTKGGMGFDLILSFNF